jgi:hypothetical protein
MPVFLINILIGVALNVAASLLGSIFAKPAPKISQAASGIRATETTGGDEPLSFIVGRYGTAGHREYSGTWGNDGDTPNAYYTLIRSVSDLPVRGLAGLFVDGEKVTIGDTHATNGYPVLEYRRGSTDYLWIEFFDGTQTTADSFMLAKFGSDPDRSWSSDMIGRGIAYARLTARFNREIFNGLPDPFFEIDGITITDPRGDGGQDNPVAQVHQVLSGINYGDEWVWGLQGLPATRLPADVWPAQMDKCDVGIDLAGGATEPRFRTGAEITVDQQPIDVITDLLEACNGRIAEIGGIYKILVAEPADPIASFTDDDVIISEGQSFDPFPGLESTFNGVTSSYVEPVEKWSVKQAPPLTNADLEAADDDRRLPAEISNAHVYSVTQRQRLDSALLLEDRRFRSHTMTMPPEWWEYEVLDAVEWTSARNGYAAKVGLITTMDDLPTGNQFIGWKEQDPADYSWATEDEQPSDVTPITIQRPAPQVMDGWTASPATFFDADDNARRPSIEVTFVAGLVDVRAVGMQVRLAGQTALVFTGEIPYDALSASNSVLLNAVLIGNTDYEVRGRYVPYSARETLWSNQDLDGTDGAWLGVTTPNIPDAVVTDIQVTQLGQELQNAYGLVTDPSIGGGVPAQLLALEQLAAQLAETVMTVSDTVRQRLDILDVQRDGAAAAIIQSQKAILTETEARAQAITEVVAQFGDALADGYLKLEATANTETAEVSISAKVKASMGDAVSQAAWVLRAAVTEDGDTADFAVMGKLYVLVPGGDGSLITAIETLGDGTIKFSGTRMGRIDSLDGLSYIDFSDGIDIYSETT